MKLRELDLDGWLKTYRFITKPAEGVDSTLYDGSTAFGDIVDEPLIPWYYSALAVRCLIERGLAQQKEIDGLRERVRLLERMLVEDDS